MLKKDLRFIVILYTKDMPKKKPKKELILPDKVYRRFTCGWGITQPTGTKREKNGKLVRLLKGSYDTIELIKYLIGMYNVPSRGEEKMGEVIETANVRIIFLNKQK